ncbi:MAG TPA: cyclic-phosphate processing receiver domain-containing protein [Phycisphaerales bacterium]|nr:cyclic-phosphate processing receiver domain-containing protein [Phycisphaerales bacterium]
MDDPPVPGPLILVLEDDPTRVEGFARAVKRAAPTAAFRVWKNAHDFIRQTPALLEQAALITLDHDLIAPRGEPDPGDGCDVARFLVGQPVVRPVIIHSSNSDRAAIMRGEFELASWPCTRVAPIGEDWIDGDWAVEAARILQKACR